ncbi:hypothetical protein ACHAWO_006488 [Cyclotella atomus]|uniref:Uncharacterized protein n=1 Tax=Cyclotella atomus TaxID=382360 RepID=A0ABD3Q1D7_9STRA
MKISAKEAASLIKLYFNAMEMKTAKGTDDNDIIMALLANTGEWRHILYDVTKSIPSSITLNVDKSHAKEESEDEEDFSVLDKEPVGKKTTGTVNDASSSYTKDERNRLKSELTAYKSKVSELEHKVDVQRLELAQLNKKVWENNMQKSKNKDLMIQVVCKLDEIKKLNEYKSKVTELEQKVACQREELAKLNRKVMEQAEITSAKANDEHLEFYRETISELKKKIDFQRAELANLNKKNVKEAVKCMPTSAEVKIARQRKELAKLNRMVANSSNGIKMNGKKSDKTTASKLDQVLQMLG